MFVFFGNTYECKNYFINYTISFYNTSNIPKFYFFPFYLNILFYSFFLLFLFFFSFSSLSPSTSSTGSTHKATHTKTHDTPINLSKLITTHTEPHSHTNINHQTINRATHTQTQTIKPLTEHTHTNHQTNWSQQWPPHPPPKSRYQTNQCQNKPHLQRNPPLIHHDLHHKPTRSKRKAESLGLERPIKPIRPRQAVKDPSNHAG